MSEIKFVGGLIAKAPPDGAPEFVKARLSFKRKALCDWLLAQQGEWINVDVKESKGGKWYAAVNEWKRDEAGPKKEAKPKAADNPAQPQGDFVDDDIPF